MTVIANWFKNANLRNKFFFAFGVPLSFVVILAFFGILTIRNVGSAFENLAEGPNKRLAYASDAVAELANCRRYILAIGYISDDPEYTNSCYESYRSSSRLIIRYLDEYHKNLVVDISLHDSEIENRELIVTGIKEMFTGPYQENVEKLYQASLTNDRAEMSRLVTEGLPMGDEMTDSLWTLREIVQEHLDKITTETQDYADKSVLLLIAIAVFLIVLSLAVSLLMSYILRVPIVEMKEGMQEITKGNFLYPIRSDGKDEFAMLSNQIGDMVDTISMLNKAVAIVDNVEELIFVTDLNYTLIYINSKVEELYNVERDSCIGQKCYAIVYGLDNPCNFCPLPKLLPRKKRFPSCEWERQQQINGENIFFSCKSSIIQWVDGSLVQIYTCKDNTLRKRHEEQQKRHAEELRAAVLAAEEASRAKSTFLASMSHEIRTPMNAVMGMSELILRKDLPPDVYENALAIKGASQNLLSIINDILDLSRIESGKLEIVEAEYQLSSLLNDIISIIRIRLIEKPIIFLAKIDPHLPAALVGDEIRIRQTLLNLLGNAVKYTREGFISLTITGKTRDGVTTLTIDISDSGIGIKKESLDNLFGDFVRLDTERNKDIEGTGLGLSITLRLCEAMGGSISVQSEYDKGSTFTVTLPQKINDYAPFAVVENAEEKSVLLYEPRLQHRDSIEQALTDLGVRFEIAEDTSALYGGLGKHSHVFIDSFIYDRVNQELQKLDNPPQLIVVVDITESPAHKPARILTLPAYSLPIANALNNIYEELFAMSATRENFIAPTANVLIVDDMTSNLMVARGLMSPYEMNITICTSGQDALDLISENHYDLVFMDHMMPKMDGIETTKHIREMEGEYFQEVPIVALTANAVSGVREMFIQNGMNDFLAKPIETSKLNAILEKWIPLKKRTRVRDEAQPVQPTENPFISALKNVSGLSADKAISVMGGSAETYEDVLKISVRLLPENVDRLNDFLYTDPNGYAIEVHGVKGVLNNIGAYELGISASELEELSKRGDMQACELLHPDFIIRLCEFISAVSVIISDAEASEKEPGDISLFLDSLDKINEAVEFYNAADAIEVLSSFRKYAFGPEIDSITEKLRHSLEHFNFDESSDLLEELRGALNSNE